MMFTEDFLGSASFVDPAGGGDANITDNLQVSDGGGPVSINLFLTNGGETEIVTSYVGDYLSIEGQLFAFGGAWANYNGAPLITSTFQYSGQSSTLIDILTPGASYTAASGTVYGSDLSAPEPGTWMLALIALAAIVPAAYRRIRGTSIRLATATSPCPPRIRLRLVVIGAYRLSILLCCRYVSDARAKSGARERSPSDMPIE
jgi:hypothetical protein